MRAVDRLAAALAVLLVSASADAAVTEPNGLQVPVTSGSEVELPTFFQSRAETINAQTDAHTTPNQFSPLCGFTATYVLNQAGSHFGLAWYNDTGQTPQASALHQLVPPNSAVGTTFSGTVIRNDPAYTGGLVGFALVGGETHYTNPAYDQQCSACSPAGPWITALIYASIVTPNAYYICFEDGPTNVITWSNDGDFNDDVYFVTGITCSGGGQPCDTGKPGICAAGLTECTATGTTCKQLNNPAAKETCNGLDDDCNGQSDEGNPCPTSETCDRGTCVHSCGGNEFPCPPGLICSNGLCVESTCATVTCPSGQVCVAGTCKAPCDGVICPHSQVCRVGACVDPCAGVQCDTEKVCQGGVCVFGCSCQACAQGKTCDAKSGQCVDSACVGVTCGAGTYCVAGGCADSCTGAVCPKGQKCTGGACVAAGADAGTPGGPDGGITPPDDIDGGATDGGANNADPNVDDFGAGKNKACGCRAVGVRGDRHEMWLLASVLAVAIGRRRRRR